MTVWLLIQTLSYRTLVGAKAISRYVNVYFLITSLHMDMFGYVWICFCSVFLSNLVKFCSVFVLYSLFKCEKIN